MRRLPEATEARPLLGISACLAGRAVRFDGTAKRDRFLTDLLGQFVRYHPVCPEVELGMGTPRETIRLARVDGEVRLLAPKSGTDHTAAMRAYADAKADELAGLGLSGYVLKSASPSCGMERVKVYDGNGVPSKSGRGLFAEALLRRLPELPVEEEGRLNDPGLRENFVARVFAYQRLQLLFQAGWGLGDLVRHHSAVKLQLLAHDPERYRALGRIVANAKGRPLPEVAQDYTCLTMAALSSLPSRGKHVNVLQHMTGYFKRSLQEAEKTELASLFEDFRQGYVPLGVPMTLVLHHIRRVGIEYLRPQTYLAPYPKELRLRDAV